MATIISGSINGSSGPAQNVRIDVWNPKGFTGQSSAISSTFSDTSGNFSITLSSAGTYAVKAVSGTASNAPYTGTGYGFQQDTQIVVVDGTTATNQSLNYTIVPPASVNPTR